jgi:DNA-binding response OmpR family regulator
MPRIFLVEDDKAIAKNLILLLRSEGFTVTHAPTRDDALAALAGKKFDLALIDISLPDGNGFTVCTEIKETQEIPVIFLTASGDEASVVTGLNMGADDYITKPFSPRVVVARVRALLRRMDSSLSPETQVWRVGDLELNAPMRTVTVGGKRVELTPSEFSLLQTLIARPGRVFTRMELLDYVQGEAYAAYERTIDVHIMSLRKKLGKCGDWIETIRGFGYKFREPNGHE